VTIKNVEIKPIIILMTKMIHLDDLTLSKCTLLIKYDISNEEAVIINGFGLSKIIFQTLNDELISILKNGKTELLHLV